MKKTFLFVAVFALAFLAAAVFVVRSQAQTNTSTGTVGSGTYTPAATGTMGTGAANNTSTRRNSSTTPGLPNTGGGGARYLK